MISIKSQAWGFDLTIASVLFVAVLVTFYLFSNNMTSENDKRASMEAEANMVGDALFSDGNPPNWDVTNVISIGILTNEKINASKLKSAHYFALAEYNRTRAIFRITNDYYVQFAPPINVDGELIDSIGLIPINPKNLFKVSRIAAFNDTLVSVGVMIWN